VFKGHPIDPIPPGTTIFVPTDFGGKRIPTRPPMYESADFKSWALDIGCMASGLYAGDLPARTGTRLAVAVVEGVFDPYDLQGLTPTRREISILRFPLPAEGEEELIR
jgi:hypothetical protein